MLLYGLGKTSLAYQLNLSVEKTGAIVEDYFDRFYGVKIWMDDLKEQVIVDGYVTYFSGRRWVLETPQQAYKVVNAMIQGSSADLTATAVVNLAEYFRENGRGRIVSIIHDEILSEVKEAHIEDGTIDEIKKIMECKHLFGVPFTVDVAVGDSYGDFK